MIAHPSHIPHPVNSNSSLSNDNTASFLTQQKNQHFSNTSNPSMPLSNNNNIAPFPMHYYYPHDFPHNIGAFLEQVCPPQPPIQFMPFYESQGTCPKNLNSESMNCRSVFPQNLPCQPHVHPDIVSLQNQYLQTEYCIQELKSIQNHLRFCKQQIAQGMIAPFAMNPPRDYLPPQGRMFPTFGPQQPSYFCQNQVPSICPQIDQQTSIQNPSSPEAQLKHIKQENILSQFSSSFPVNNIHPNQQDNSINQKRSYGNLHKESSQTKIEESYEDLEQSVQMNKKICNEETKTVSSPPQQVQQVSQLINTQNKQQSSKQLKTPSLDSNTISNLCSMTKGFQLQLEQKLQQYCQATIDIPVKGQNQSIDHIKKLVKKEFSNQYPQVSIDLQDKKKAKKDQEPTEEDSEERKAKKEIQNDSNYTKNLLKGFRRFTLVLLRDNKEAQERFTSYFYDNSLSNEFILCLLDDSPFTKEFQQFLDTDPTWWIKEAKIKDIQRQLKFFEAVKARNYSEIRTKRKIKKSNPSISPSALSMLLISQPHVRYIQKSEPVEIATISNQANV